jgi:hypothetical protein
MDRNLAYFSSSSPGSGPWSTILIVALIIAICASPMVVRWLRTIRGPVLTGTARVLSLRQFGSTSVNGPTRQICRFRLTVELPGREPYDVTHWQNFVPWALDAVAPGNTVPVEVDASRPKRVRIGHSQQIRPRFGGAGSSYTVFDLPFKTPSTVVFNQPTTPPHAVSSPAPSGARPNPTDLADLSKQSPAAGPVISAADLLASGQRAPGVLKSFRGDGDHAAQPGQDSEQTRTH